MISKVYTRKASLKLEFEWTPSFCWYLIPTIEINTSVKEVAINILCLGIYFSWRRAPGLKDMRTGPEIAIEEIMHAKFDKVKAGKLIIYV